MFGSSGRVLFLLFFCVVSLRCAMAVSAAGRKKFAAFGVIIVFDGAVLALSTCINRFQSFSYVTDLLPFVLSSFTMILLLLLILIDLFSRNAWSARPWFEIPLLAFLSLVWIGLDVFLTIRWNDVSFSCNSMLEYHGRLGTLVRCREFSALRVMIWVLPAALLILTLSLFHVVLSRSHSGNSQAWNTSLARYESTGLSSDEESIQKDVSESMFRRASSLSNILLFGNSAKSVSTVATHDYFAPLPLNRSSYASSAFEGSRSAAGTRSSPQSPVYGYVVHYRQDLRDFETIPVS